MAKRNRAVIRGFKQGWFTKVSPRVQKQGYSQGILYLDDAWEDCKNVAISPEGTIRNRLGCDAMHTTPAGTAIAQLYQYWKANGNSFLLAFANKVTGGASAGASAWNATTESWNTKSGSIQHWAGGINDKIFGETFNDKFVIVNGTDQPCYWDGVLASFVEMPSTCYPAKCIRGFKNYLFLANTTESGTPCPGRVRWSVVGDAYNASDWPAANYMDLDPDDGDEITGMELLGDSLIVFKERKIYAIDYVGGPWQFDYEIKMDGRGCVSGGSITSIYNDLIFLAEDGFYAFTGKDIEDISFKIKDKILEIHPDYWVHVMSAPLEEEDQLWFTIPYAGPERIGGAEPTATKPCNEVWIYDYDKEAWYRHDMALASLGFWYVESEYTIADLTKAFDQYSTWAWDDRFGLEGLSQLISGDYRGFVAQQNTLTVDATSVHEASSATIDSYLKTRWLDLGDPFRTDRVTRMIFVVTPEGSAADYNLDIVVRTDWDKDSTGTAFTVSMAGDQQLHMIEKRVDTTFQCRALQLEIGTDGANEPWTLHEIVVEYEKKGRVGTPSYG